MNLERDKKVFKTTWKKFVEYRKNGHLEYLFELLKKTDIGPTDINVFKGFIEGKYDDFQPHDKSAVLATMQFLLWYIADNFPNDWEKK